MISVHNVLSGDQQLDDEDNDRISDPVSTSTKKLLLKDAYFFENDDDVTTNKPDQLTSRLEDCLSRLWRLRHEK